MKKMKLIIALHPVLSCAQPLVLRQLSRRGTSSRSCRPLKWRCPTTVCSVWEGSICSTKVSISKHGFIVKPRWAPVCRRGTAARHRRYSAGLGNVGIGGAGESESNSDPAYPALQTPHNSILVRIDAPYKSLKDLKDKPFAVPPEVTSAYNNFDYIMKKQGIDIEKFFQLKKFGAAAGISTTLERGDVEAGLQLGGSCFQAFWLPANIECWCRRVMN